MTETQKLIKALKSGRAQVKTIQGQTVIQFKPVEGQIKRTVKISTSRTYSTSTPKISAKAPMKVKKIKAISTKTQAEQLYQKRYDKAMHAARRLPKEVQQQYVKTKMAAYKAKKASMISVKKTKLALTKGSQNAILHLKNIENWLKDNVGGTARDTLSANINEWLNRGEIQNSDTIQNVIDRLNSDKELSNADFKKMRQLIYGVANGSMDQNEAEAQLIKLLA